VPGVNTLLWPPTRPEQTNARLSCLSQNKALTTTAKKPLTAIYPKKGHTLA